MMSFRAALKAARKSSNMTVAQIAELADISVATIYRIEERGTNSWDVMVRLCDVLPELRERYHLRCPYCLQQKTKRIAPLSRVLQEYFYCTGMSNAEVIKRWNSPNSKKAIRGQLYTLALPDLEMLPHIFPDINIKALEKANKAGHMILNRRK